MATHLRLASASSTRQDGPSPSRAEPIRVILADDHELMRLSLRRLLEGEADIRVIGEATELSCAVRLTRERRPCVLLLDLRLPGGSSIETIADLRKSIPSTQIVVMTMEANPAFAHCAFTAGAAGYVSKDLADDELLEAVRTAAVGGRYAGSRVSHVLPRPLLAAASE